MLTRIGEVLAIFAVVEAILLAWFMAIEPWLVQRELQRRDARDRRRAL